MREHSGRLRLAVSVLVFALLVLPAAPVVGAQDGTGEEPPLPDPGLLPGSPFYFVKQLLERVRLALARSTEDRLVLMARFLEVRLAEAEALAGRGKESLVERTMERYRELAERAALEVERASAQGRDITEALLALERATRRSREVLGQVLERVPDQARGAVRLALEASDIGREVCLRVMERIREGLAPGRPEVIDRFLSRLRGMLPGPGMGHEEEQTQGQDEGQGGGN
ncbi:MAG TPA: hypothetical protein DHW14_01660 [Clostridiales bacterium]|nr:hypothetical protein [Clostridiales bacterium]